MAREPQRLESLTALRFAAALLVFLVHARLRGGLPDVFAPADVGWVGVSFFFVLSGFVLTWSARPAQSAGGFYWRRFARVWPLHALIVVLVVVLGLGQPAGGAVWSNVLLLQGPMSGGLTTLNPPSWSLTAEACFYLAFPFLLVRVTAARRLGLVAIMAVTSCLVCGAAAAVIAGPARMDLWAFEFPVVRGGEFVLGMTIAVALARGWSPPPVRVAAATLVLVYLVVWQLDPAKWFGSALLAPTLALLIASCAHADAAGRVRTPRWAARLGHWSFAFYLVHWPVLAAVERADLDGLSAGVVAFTITLALSALLHTSFERPVERWLRGLSWNQRLRPLLSRT